jgi:serine phosphatase RsbU (regulator of sigma subunit)/PAS domain-containing protein
VNAIPIGPPRLSESLLDAVVESVPVGVLILDADLRVVRANRALCEMTGKDEAAQLGRGLGRVLPWLPEADVRRALETGVASQDVELQSDDTGVLAHRFAVSLRPLGGADGAPAIACLVRDVAELVAWRRGLGGIEQLAADLSGAATLADVTDLIVSRSRELVGAETVAAALRTEDGNDLEMVGMAGFDERTERRWSRFDLRIRTPMGDAVKSGKPVFLEGHDEYVRDYPQLPRLARGESIAAVPVRGRGGVIGAISFRFRTGRRLERGDRSAMLTIGQHYGQALDRARLFEAAESERQRLATLMHQLPVGVAIAEAPSGHIVAVNAKATEIWRVPPAGSEPITDVTPYVAYHPDGRRYGPQDWPIARSLATGEVVENDEIEVEFGDGARGWVNISSRPVLDSKDRVLGAVTTLVDVTEPRRRETEARFVADATDLLAESLDPEEALRRLARLVVPRLADWCVVYIRDGARIRTVALEHSDPRKIELGWELNRRYPTDLDRDAGVAQVMRTGVSQLTPSLTREMVAAAAPDAQFTRIIFDELGLRSALTVPLSARGQLFGALVLVSAESDRVFDERDVAFAEDFASRAALAVANAQLYAEQQEIARTLQRSLLPLRLPDLPCIEIAARYRAAGERNMVGGDFYDFWEVGEGSFGIAIGDVCGKGAAAAALTALARHTVRTASLTLPDHRPADVMRALNDAVMKRAGSGQFCTVAHAHGTPVAEGFDVTIASGGHPLPFVIRADGSVEQPGQPGTLLGIFPDIQVHEHRIVLRPGDQIVMWTDGVSDRRGDGELFGEERLRELLVANAGRTPEAIAGMIEEVVVGFSKTDPQDDIAVVVARIRPA